MSYEIGPGITIGYDIVWLRIRDEERSKLYPSMYQMQLFIRVSYIFRFINELSRSTISIFYRSFTDELCKWTVRR